MSEQAGGDLQLFQYFAEYQWDLIISCEGSNPITSFPYFSRKKKSGFLVINANRARKKRNRICGVPVTNSFLSLSYVTGHVLKPYLRKCGECKLALFGGEFLVSVLVLINFDFQ